MNKISSKLFKLFLMGLALSSCLSACSGAGSTVVGNPNTVSGAVDWAGGSARSAHAATIFAVDSNFINQTSNIGFSSEILAEDLNAGRGQNCTNADGLEYFSWISPAPANVCAKSYVCKGSNYTIDTRNCTSPIQYFEFCQDNRCKRVSIEDANCEADNCHLGDIRVESTAVDRVIGSLCQKIIRADAHTGIETVQCLILVRSLPLLKTLLPNVAEERLRGQYTLPEINKLIENDQLIELGENDTNACIRNINNLDDDDIMRDYRNVNNTDNVNWILKYLTNRCDGGEQSEPIIAIAPGVQL